MTERAGEVGAESAVQTHDTTVNDPYEEWSDYYEAPEGDLGWVPTLTCRMPGCEWQHPIGWADFEVIDGTSETQRIYLAHWNDAHG